MYIPMPICTNNVNIPEDVLELIELLAKNTHEVWAKNRISEGWSYGPERNDPKKQTPCLVPYEELSEEEKLYDRETSRQTIAVILSMGYQLISPSQKRAHGKLDCSE